jgi:lipoprotein-releasing system ATP-binding protein
MTNQTSLLELQNITKSYITAGEKLIVLENANLIIEKQTKIAIVGESGSGKSTFLHIASLLDHFDNGKIILEGKEISNLKDKDKSVIRNKNFGFVYQAHLLLQEFTVLENVLMPILIERKIKKEDTAYAMSLLKKLNIESYAKKFPSELSGGQQQRVAIARALVQKPKIVFADEPTGNLDPATAKMVKELFNNLIAEQGIALVIVTHDMNMAESCDKIYKLQNKSLQI